jgi:hypothetical protein
VFSTKNNKEAYMTISKYCMIAIISIGAFIRPIVTGLYADDINFSNSEKIHRSYVSPKTNTSTIQEKAVIPMKGTTSINGNTTSEQNAQAKICLDLLHNAKTTIDLMRQNCAAHSPSRYTFNQNVQDLKANILNWGKNHCTDSILSPDHKITYNMISSEFNKIQNMCINRCWHTMQEQIKQGTFSAFLGQCRECCGFYPPDIIQRCSNECNRTVEAKEEAKKDINELMDQMQKGITEIMSMMDIIIKTNGPLTQ